MVDKKETDKIIKAFYKVYNTLGHGFLERVYQNALYYELVEQGFKCEVQKPIDVYYENKRVGEYFAGILIDSTIILELKATEGLRLEHEYQLVNYLKATHLELGFLLNFGKSAESRRKVFTHYPPQ